MEVPAELLAAIPQEIRADAKARKRYLQAALEIGVKAMSQAGVSLDVSFVKSTFDDFIKQVRRYRDEGQRSVEELLSANLTGEDSRLARMLLAEFGERGRLATQLEGARRQLTDPEVKSSLPSRVAELITAALEDEKRRVSGLVNAADPASPLGLFLDRQDRTVRGLQEDYGRKMESLARQLEDIRTALSVDDKLRAMQAVVDETQEKSTGKGVDFEEDGYDALAKTAAVFGDEVESCGTTRVDGTLRKVGDQLIHIRQRGAPELSIVVEQKAGPVGRKPLLRQMREAMALRGAQAAIGLMQRKHMGKTQASYEQHGLEQVIVGVDWSDETDWFALDVAYRTLRTHLLATALSREAGAVSADEVRSAVKRIELALGDVQRMRAGLTEARKSIDTVSQTITELEGRVKAELLAVESALR